MHGDPLAAPPNFQGGETVSAQGAEHCRFLIPQDPRDDQMAARSEERRPDRQRLDQDLAEEICGNDIECSGEILIPDVAGCDLDVADAVGARVSSGRCAGEGIVLDCEDVAGSKMTAGNGENAAAGARVEHRPASPEWAGDSFEQAQTHRGRRMLARAEGHFRGNNDPARTGTLRRCRLFFWHSQDDKARADAQWPGFGLPGKMLKPVSPQLFDAAAEFAEDLVRFPICFAGNLERHALHSRTSYHGERVPETFRQVFATKAPPRSRNAFSPKVHRSSLPSPVSPVRGNRSQKILVSRGRGTR